MSTGKISSKTDIITDPFKTGLNYTGIVNANAAVVGGALATGVGGNLAAQAVRYGFIMARGADGVPGAPVSITSQVTGLEQVILQLNPQQIEQDEPAATNITYTQNGGKYIERRGCLSKNITLSGTTGFNPNPQLPAVLRASLPAASIIAKEGPASGAAEFYRLRNLFRGYWSIFSDERHLTQRASTLMIFLNGKDDEAWVVEPLNFRMSRVAGRNNFTYAYTISMQTIAPVEAMNFDTDILTSYQQVGSLIAKVSAVAADATRVAAVLGTVGATLAGSIRDATSVVQGLLVSVAADLSGIATGAKEVVSLPSVIKGQMDDIKNSFMGAWGAMLSIGDYSASIYNVDPIPFEVHAALASMAEDLADLSSRAELYSTNFQDTWAKALSNYDPSYGVGGYNQELVAPLQKTGVQEATILPGDTLQSIAIRELGNAERFMEIILLNSLKPPYLSPSQQDRQPNTLAPNDPILLPIQGSTSEAHALVRTTVFTDPVLTTTLETYLTATQLQLDTHGRDFRIDQWKGFSVDVTGRGSTGVSTYIPQPGDNYFATYSEGPLTGSTFTQFFIGPSDYSMLFSLLTAPGAPTYYLVYGPGTADAQISQITGGDAATGPYTGLYYVAFATPMNTRSDLPAGAVLLIQNGTTLPASNGVVGGSGSGAEISGYAGTVTGNTADTITIDTPLPVQPVPGGLVRMYLTRSEGDIVQRKSSQDQLLGVDLKLENNDLVVDASGKLQLVDGADNMRQAVQAKLNTLPGDLAAHPSAGLAFYPGTKLTPDLLFGYQAAVRQTLLSDARVDSLEQVTVVADGDRIALQGSLILVNGSEPYALDTKGAS